MRLLVDALATARLARLATRDAITAPAREQISCWVDAGRVGAWAEEFSRCEWCLSIWSAVIVLLVRRDRRSRALLTILACSELAGLLSVWRHHIEAA